MLLEANIMFGNKSAFWLQKQRNRTFWLFWCSVYRLICVWIFCVVVLTVKRRK